MSSHIYGFDDTEHQWEPVHISSGKLKVESTINTAGLATDTLQTAGNASLASLDTKVTTCNTGAIAGSVAVTGVAGTVTVDGSAVTQPISGSVGVSGTVTVDGSAVTQPVSGSVAVSAVAGTVTVDGSAVTQPVSAASLPLPSGAATSALQTAGNTSLSTLADCVDTGVDEVKVFIKNDDIGLATHAEQLLIKQTIIDSNDNNYNTQSVVVAATSTANSASYNVTNYAKVELIAVGTVSANMTHVQVQWSDDDLNWYHPSFYQTLSTSYGADGTSDAQETLQMSCPARAKYVRAQLYNPSTTVSDTVKLVWSRVH